MADIPDKNLFMMCRSLNRAALTPMPSGYRVRPCRKEELAIWRAMPFDDAETAQEYDAYMAAYFERVYRDKEETFFADTLFVVDEADKPVGTCLLWRAYGEFNTIHWLKVLQAYEGKGIGRALLSLIMRDLVAADYPVYLHTQPGSYRAIKLYSDFGFELITDPVVGQRPNEWQESLPYLKAHMPEAAFDELKTCKAPAYFLDRLQQFPTNEF